MEDLTIGNCLAGLNGDFDNATKLQIIELLQVKSEETDNVTSDEAKELSQFFINRIFKVKSTAANVNLYLGILCNATLLERNSRAFCDLLVEDQKFCKHFHKLIEKFLSFNPQTEDELEDDEVVTDEKLVAKDPFQHIGSILCNLCQGADGRAIILKPSSGYMEKLVIQVRSQNVNRRRSALSCIRSCLFDKEIHWWMVDEVKVLTPLAYNLVPPISFTERERTNMDPLLWMSAENKDKKVEPHKDLMIMMLECMVILCTRRGIREELRKRKLYAIVKNLDTVIDEDDEAAHDQIYKIVDFLEGDEDPDNPIDKPGDKIIDTPTETPTETPLKTPLGTPIDATDSNSSEKPTTVFKVGDEDKEKEKEEEEEEEEEKDGEELDEVD